VLHVPGRQKLPLLHVDSAPSRRRRQQQIGLPAEKGRNLQYIDDFCHDLSLIAFMNIREHRHTHFVLDALQNFHPHVQLLTAKGGNGSTVRLIKGRLKDKGHVEALADRRNLRGHLQGKIFGLNDTGTTNQRERMTLANAEGIGNTRVYHGLAPRSGL
jgi:hypothetical protein